MMCNNIRAPRCILDPVHTLERRYIKQKKKTERERENFIDASYITITNQKYNETMEPGEKVFEDPKDNEILSGNNNNDDVETGKKGTKKKD